MTTVFGRRGVIAVVVVLLHALAFTGLMLTRIVDGHTAAAERQSVLTLVMLPPLPVKSVSTPRRKGLKTGAAALPEYRWIVPGAAGANAITIPSYVASGPPHCPSPLKPGSKEWERRCPWLAKAQKPAEDDGYEDFSLVPRDSPAFAQWEAERKARNKPVEVPCAYTRKETLPGGPYESSSAMVDVGCAVRQLFGR